MKKLSWNLCPDLRNLFMSWVTQTLLILTALGNLAHADSTDWWVKNTSWSAQDEKNFSTFVSKIGQARFAGKCRTFSDCLKTKDNPYYQLEDQNLEIFADCADLPYLFRAYFAWKNHLPFAYELEVSPDREAGSDPNGDVRYSSHGNRVDISQPLLMKNSNPLNFLQECRNMQNQISSAMYRVTNDYHETPLNDFYSIKINKNTLQPGTVIYDPNGHVAIVWKVNSGPGQDGSIRVLDSHPDNSMTENDFSALDLYPSSIYQGGGFKKFRPLNLLQATLDSNGNWIGGSIELLNNEAIPDFSTEQHDGSFGGLTFIYYLFLKNKITDGTFKYDPLVESSKKVTDLCKMTQERVQSIEAATRAGIHLKEHPETLPQNIYGADGDWETFSTPSRDARLKAAFVSFEKELQHIIKLQQNRDPMVRYSGADLKAELAPLLKNQMNQCQITYTLSTGTKRTFSLFDFYSRVFLISFDPYHCPEQRWGENDPALLAACTDPLKLQWYQAEQYLRNMTERDTKLKTDLPLDVALSQWSVPTKTLKLFQILR
jgi:hypothetical protein